MMHRRAVSRAFCLRILCLLLCIGGADSASAMNSEERLLFANGLYRRGLYDLAAPEYRALMTNNAALQMQDLAAFRLGECYRNLGQTNDAAEAYALVINQHPQSVFMHRAAFRRAEIDWQSGRLKDAASQFQKVIERKPPEDIEAASLYYLGISLAGIDRFKDAEKNLRRMLRQHASSPYADYARIALADLLDQQGGSAAEIAGLLNTVVKKPETPALGAEATAKAALLAYRQRDMAEASLLFVLLADQTNNPWQVRTRLEAAWSHLFSDKLEKARVNGVEGLAAAPASERPVWLYLLANIERRAKAPDEAKKHYDELLASAPAHELAPVAAYEASGLAFQASEYERVLKLAEFVGANEDYELSLLWMKAGALRGLGRNTEAIKGYETIVAAHPQSDRAPAAAYQLALISEELGSLTNAASAYLAVAETYKDSAVAPDALMAAASASLRSGQPERAMDAWNKMIKNHPDHPGVDEALMGRARAEAELGRDKPAAATLGTLIASHTNSRFIAEAHYLRATLYEKSEQFEEAEFHYLRAVSLKPSPALARQIQHRRVAVLQRQGRSEDAAALMNRLLVEGGAGQLPSPLLEWLARWNLEQSAYPEAEVAGRRLAEAGDTPAWKQVGWYIVGTAALAQKKAAPAREAFDAAARLGLNTRETAEAHFQLGLMALEQKKYEEAIGSFSQAAERASSDNWMDIRARSYLQLGLAHEAMENWADAGRYYLGVGVLFDDPELTPESLYRAAGVLHAQQQNRDRDRILAELQERYPESIWVTRAIERWGGQNQENL